MENKKNGIFLGIISIATLIVTIIGATFAYFSVQVQSENNAIETKAYEFSMDVTVEKLLPNVNEKGLIPLKPTEVIGNDQYLIRAVNHNNCIDDKGYQVCQLYKVTIQNNTSNTENLTLTVKTITNTPGSGSGRFQDLKFQVLEGTYESNSDNSFGLSGSVADLPENVNETVQIKGTSTPPSPMVIPVAANEQVAKYFVIYLGDNGNEQSSQMGASYTGQLVFSTGDGANHLTGTFSTGQTS